MARWEDALTREEAIAPFLDEVESDRGASSPQGFGKLLNAKTMQTEAMNRVNTLTTALYSAV